MFRYSSPLPLPPVPYSIFPSLPTTLPSTFCCHKFLLNKFHTSQLNNWSSYKSFLFLPLPFPCYFSITTLLQFPFPLPPPNPNSLGSPASTLATNLTIRWPRLQRNRRSPHSTPQACGCPPDTEPGRLHPLDLKMPSPSTPSPCPTEAA